MLGGVGPRDHQGKVLWHTLDVHHHHSQPGSEEWRRHWGCPETSIQHRAFLYPQTHLWHAVLHRGHPDRPQPHLWCHHWHLRWSQNWENKQGGNYQEHLLYLWSWAKGLFVRASLWHPIIKTFFQAFDNKNVTFEEHIRSEHNMWHYLYFIVLIKVKDPTEFTGPESYVHQMVKVRTLLFALSDAKTNEISDLESTSASIHFTTLALQCALWSQALLQFRFLLWNNWCS